MRILFVLIALALVGCNETKHIEEPGKFHLGDIVEVTDQTDFYFGCYGVVVGKVDQYAIEDKKAKTITWYPRYSVQQLTCPKLKNVKGMTEKSIEGLKACQCTLSLKK